MNLDVMKMLEQSTKASTLLKQYRGLATELMHRKRAMDQHAMVVVLDENWQPVESNEKFRRFAALTLPSARPDFWSTWEPESGVATDEWADVRQKVQQGEVWSGEISGRKLTGERFWLAVTIVPMQDDALDGHPRYMAMHTDISDLRRAELELATIRRREIGIGARIQNALLIQQPYTGSEGIWSAACTRPSQDIDGDFVECIRVGEDCVDLVVGDVMGKGVPAALLGAAAKMELSRTLVRIMAERSGSNAMASPAEIVSALHQSLDRPLQELETFIALSYIRVDLKHQCLSWVGCGAEEALLLRANGAVQWLPNQQPPLGAGWRGPCRQDEIRLDEADALMQFSDGLTDAYLPSGGRLGRQALLERVTQLYRQFPVPAMVLGVLERDLRLRTANLADDATMLYTVIHHPSSSMFYRRYPVALGAIGTVRQDLLQALSMAKLEQTDRTIQFPLGCVEAFTNAVRHSQNMDMGAGIEMLCSHDAHKIEVTLSYLAEPYDPSKPRTPSHRLLNTDGGLGTQIMQSVCDELEYTSQDGVNSVRMAFYSSTRSNL